MSLIATPPVLRRSITKTNVAGHGFSQNRTVNGSELLELFFDHSYLQQDRGSVPLAGRPDTSGAGTVLGNFKVFGNLLTLWISTGADPFTVRILSAINGRTTPGAWRIRATLTASSTGPLDLADYKCSGQYTRVQIQN
jgi:hypothetical protein